jgi:hypothetical protein
VCVLVFKKLKEKHKGGKKTKTKRETKFEKIEQGKSV